MMKVTLLCLLIGAVNAFVAPKTALMTSTSTLRGNSPIFAVSPDNDETNTLSNNNDLMSMIESSGRAAMIGLSAWASVPLSSLAAGPDWGIFEGRIGSMLHPLTMAALLLISLYTALLGFQWRRQRTIGDDISELKKTMPDLGGAASVTAAINEAKEADDTARVSALTAALTIENQIKELQDERKSLSQAGPRDKHFNQGALLACIGTLFAIEGPLNTYARAGKLFPGPHLYAGAGLVCLWAVAYACVPFMQKGSDTARSIHIGANVAGIGLFAWQVVSGIPIMLKVIEKTSWP